MKTENLTLSEAVQAMKDGRCSNAARPVWPNRHWLEMGTDHDLYMVSDECGTENFMPSAASILATDYYLINPVVETEEREVEEWALLFSDGRLGTSRYSSELAARQQCERANVIPVKTTYTVPKVEKEKKRVEVPARTDPSGYFWIEDQKLIPHDKTGVLTFEYYG